MAITDKKLIDIDRLSQYHDKNKEYVEGRITDRISAKVSSYVVEDGTKITLKTDAKLPQKPVAEYNNVKNIFTIAEKTITYSDVKIGDVIFLKVLEAVDYWVSAIDTENQTFAISILEAQKTNLTEYYKKGEVDGKFATIQQLGVTDENLSQTAAQVEINKTNIGLIEEDIEKRYTKDEVDTKLDGYYTKTDIQNNYYTKQHVDDTFATKANLGVLGEQVSANAGAISGLDTDMTTVEGKVRALESATIATEDQISALFGTTTQ